MSSTNLSFEQGSSDKDSKSDDESKCEDLSDEEQDEEVAYKELLKDSLRLSRINDKLFHKLKVFGSQNLTFSFELDDARAKVSQLESQRAILSNTIIAAGKEKELITAQLEEVRKELNSLQIEYDLLQAEKNDVCGKLRMVLSELVSAKSSLERMNKGSITLDEILMQQRSEKQETGLGFNSESSTSMQSGKSVFVKGPALYSGILATPNAKHGNLISYKSVPKSRFTLICHF